MENFREPKASIPFCSNKGVALKKMLRMVRFTLFCFFLGLLQVMAVDSYSQQTRISVSHQNQRLEEVLKTIEGKTEFFFLYNKDLIDVEQTVNITASNQTIMVILDELLRGTDISYTIINRQIILTNLEGISALESGQQRAVTGTVTDRNGMPLPGVTVLVKGTRTGTVTGADGKFSLTDIAADAILSFSFIGMKSMDVPAEGRTSFNVVLEEETIGIEEVVAIGYGTVRKGDLTGSVASVSTRDFEKVPASNALQILQGRATGLQITTNSGLPGSGSSVLIRGVQSINGSNSPIYVVDGMITDNIDNLNPGSIESVSVLKDASAAAIYGARAANGVILVSTKRGEGKKDLQISLNSYYGFQNESNLKARVLNASQFLELFTETYQNAGMDLLWKESDLEAYRGVDTNWKQLMLQTGIIQNYDLAVNGGSEKSNYYISAGYLDQVGMVIETSFKKYTLNFNSDHKINDWIKFGNTINIYTTTTGGDGTQYANALRKSPLVRAYEENGDYGIIRNTNLEHMFANPIWAAKEIINNDVAKGLQGNMYLNLKLLKGLDFTARGSMDYSSNYSTNFTPAVSPHYGWQGSTINSVAKGHYETVHWIGDFLLNYNKTFAENHNLKALLGYSLEESSYEYLTGNRTGTPTDAIQFLDAGDPTSQVNSNGFSDWAFLSMFSRLDYNYKQKYLFTATVRRDGTSRLSGDNKFGIFPSASVAWRVSDEEFFQNVGFIDDLKVRASVGTLGNVLSVGTYGTIPSLASRGAVLNQNMAKGYTLTSAVNSDLKWESVAKRNLGIDAQMMDNKLYSTVDLFIEDTYDLLFNEPIAYSTGLSGTPLINAGKVRNSGYEIEIGYRNSNKDWRYDINFNLSHVLNEVVDLGGRDLRTSGIVEGYPVRSFFGYKANGIIRDASQLDIYKTGGFTKKGIGDIALMDIDGYDADGKLTGKPDGKVDAADRTIIGNRRPDFTYGTVGTVSYKNWGLQVQLQGVHGFDLSFQPAGDYSFVKLMSGLARNEDARVMNRYHPTKNPEGTWPRLMKDDRGNNSEMSDFWLARASYLRVRNINLNYSLPQTVCSSLKLSSLSLYTSIQNAYTFTNYEGPEVDTTADPTGVPQPRTWTLGFKATF